MTAVEELAEASVPVSEACTALRVPRASFYRHRRPPPTVRAPKVTKARPAPARALTLKAAYSKLVFGQQSLASARE